MRIFLTGSVLIKRDKFVRNGYRVEHRTEYFTNMGGLLVKRCVMGMM